ncbi:hypothetical protein [Alsobacter sp. R-9]
MPFLSAACLETDPRGLALLRRCLATDAAYRVQTARPVPAGRPPQTPQRSRPAARPLFRAGLGLWHDTADGRY